MDWIEVSVNTPAAQIDMRCDAMAAMGAEGFVIENEEDFNRFLENNTQYWDYVDEELEDKYKGVSRIKCYLSDDGDGKAVLERIRNAYGDAVSTAVVRDSDWENNWRQYYQPIEVGKRLVVVPEWIDDPEGERLPLRLDPGLIFGTGSHATTRMCLAALEEHVTADSTVLDLGCGSGILGIGALVLGCRSCVGCDIDPKAPEVAMSNAALNGIDGTQYKVYAGDILKDAGMRRSFAGQYDIVLANIVSDVIIPLSGIVGDFLKKDGVFITSGIIEGRQEEVRSALEKAGLRVLSHFCEEDWHCFVCRPSGEQ